MNAARIVVERGSDGVDHARVLAPSATLAPRPVYSADGVTRIALVGVSMTLLSGDRVEVDVEVVNGAAVEIVEPAAVVAHRAVDASSWAIRGAVSDGGALLWAGSPMIAAEGCIVHRTLELDLHPGARTLMRETLVRGRNGEQGGRLTSRTLAGELLREELEVGTPMSGTPSILGSAKVMDSITALGWRPQAAIEEPEVAVLELEGPGRIVRALDAAAAVPGSRLARIYAAWRGELASRYAARTDQHPLLS